MRKLKLLIAAAALIFGVTSANAETDYTSLMSSTWTGSSGDFGGGKERYQAANYESGKIMYQSFIAPAAGIYEIKFYAVTSSTSGRGFNNIYGENIAQAYATAGGNKATVAMTVIDQTGCTLVADANIRTLSVEAAEGETIEYGLENIATGGNWYTIKELSAKMKTIVEIFQSQYDDALAIYNNSTENEEGAKATFKTYLDAMNTALTGTLVEAQTASDNLAAALVTYESKSYPIKGSGVKYDFTSKMNMTINAWTCVQGNGPNQYGFTGATETYGNTVAGEVMYQTISGLANGEYEIHFYAVANAANGGGVEGTKTTVYANDQELEIDVITQSSCTPSDYERTFTVMVKDGTIKYGITNTVAAGNWNICKNVALYMTGAPDLSDYYEAIAEKLTMANSLVSEAMNAEVFSNLSTAINAADGYESITVIGTLETISNDLTTAINAATASIDNYATALAIITAANTLDEDGKAFYVANETVAAIQSAYDNGTLEAVTSEQETACGVALRAAAKAQTSEGADMTLAIINPNIDGNANGWTIEKTVDGNGPMYGTTAFEYWSYTAGEGGFDYYQVITELPNGIYTISAEMFNDQVAKEGDTFAAAAGVYGTSGETTVYGLITELGMTLNRYTTDEILVSDGILRIGVKNKTTEMPARWVVADNFKITFVRAATVDDYKGDLATAINNASAARKQANEGAGVFQIPVEAGETLAGAIQESQNVYESTSATIESVNEQIANLESAVENYENTELNAPAEGTRYYLTVATNGHAKEGNAIVVTLGATGDNNKTGYGFAAAANPNANLAQAFIFTQVSGNNYNISVERPEGTVYLTYGSLNNSAAGWAKQQIQGTTEVSAAGEFKIVASTTENVFGIVNTVFEGADNFIDCQDGGALYTDTNIDLKDFSLTEASKAEVNVSISSTVKYGTRIFPFVPELPTGVKAYSCEAAEGKVLTLVEVETPAANTPYILENTTENDVNETLTGWGVASSLDAVTAGWLTGVYVATDAPVGSYVLQNNDNKVGFYVVEEIEGKVPTVGAYRCYLTKPAADGARAAYFFGEDGTTGISAIEALTTGDAQIFNAAGAQLPTLQKGMNIIRKADGTSYKVMVK